MSVRDKTFVRHPGTSLHWLSMALLLSGLACALDDRSVEALPVDAGELASGGNGPQGPDTSTPPPEGDGSPGGTSETSENSEDPLPLCGAGSHRCGDECVSNDSVESCGETSCTPCPVPTGGFAICDGVRCGGSCPDGLALCGEECIDENAPCEGACAPGSHACGDACLSDLDTGSCGSSCEACPVPENGNATCDGLQCGFTCEEGFHACGSACADDRDVASCGSSCEPCTAPVGGTATCDGTTCGGACPQNQKLCAGACIPENQACLGVCPAGTHDCNRTCQPNTSVNSCGTSCNPCTAPANAAPTCNGTSCGFTCINGTSPCGNSCLNLNNNNNNCGGCGQSCPATSFCNGGACVFQNGSLGQACNVQANNCVTGLTCSGGTCVCAAGTKPCGGSCIPNAQCCGGCPMGTDCENGQCLIINGGTCSPGGTACLSRNCSAGRCCPQSCGSGGCNAQGSCSCPNNQQFARGACRRIDGQTCTNGNDCVNACTSWFADTDGDGFGDRSAPAGSFCGTQAPRAGVASNDRDCCDARANVFPGQTVATRAGVFNTDPACPDWKVNDYDCDNVLRYINDIGPSTLESCATPGPNNTPCAQRSGILVGPNFFPFTLTASDVFSPNGDAALCANSSVSWRICRAVGNTCEQERIDLAPLCR